MRYLPHSDHERADMLGVIGARSIDDLFVRVPERAYLKAPVDLPNHSPEFLVEAHMKALAGRNRAAGERSGGYERNQDHAVKDRAGVPGLSGDA
jgi:glycine dehydrogenase subunit 1